MKSSFAKKITPFLTIFKKHVFYCAFQLISIKLQLGKVDKVKNNKKIQLTNTVKQNKNVNFKKKRLSELSVFANKWFIYYIAKSIGSPPSNERYDYFSNFLEYKS